MEMIKVTLSQGDKQVEVPLRKGLGLQALARHSQWIEFDCREADCGICICRVNAGAENLSPPTPPEADFLRAMHADANERLACQCRVFGDVSLDIDDFTIPQ